jgi:hypothetical protein
MAAMVEVRCRCGTVFSARVADRKRGWAKFCSKSCKAKEQERRTGQYGNYLHSGVSREKYLRYANEFGGVPQFHRATGEYEGFQDGGFDNTSCQNSERD